MIRRASWLMALALFLAIMIGLVVRFHAVPKSDLEGTYLCSYPFGTETLVLQSNGAYSQVMNYTRLGSTSHSGSWHLNSRHQVVLEDALLVDSGFGSPATHPVISNWILDVRHTFGGTIVMPVNEDLGLEFRKVVKHP
jgi:hypothetical protein